MKKIVYLAAGLLAAAVMTGCASRRGVIAYHHFDHGVEIKTDAVNYNQEQRGIGAIFPTFSDAFAQPNNDPSYSSYYTPQAAPSSGYMTIQGDPPLVQGPDCFIDDGYELVGVNSGGQCFVSVGGNWVRANPIVVERFRNYARIHPGWYAENHGNRSYGGGNYIDRDYYGPNGGSHDFDRGGGGHGGPPHIDPPPHVGGGNPGGDNHGGNGGGQGGRGGPGGNH